jgi:hypothetical protein
MVIIGRSGHIENLRGYKGPVVERRRKCGKPHWRCCGDALPAGRQMIIGNG